MTRRIRRGVRLGTAIVLVALVGAATVLAQPGNQGDQQGGKGDQPQGKRVEGQGGMMGGQAGMGGMGMT
jgi:hypothetical protein